MNIDELARAFVRGATKGGVHNARIEESGGETRYVLHRSVIARRWSASGRIEGDWCGYYTATTANHLKAIAAAAGGRSSGYAAARDSRAGKFTIHEGV